MSKVAVETRTVEPAGGSDPEVTEFSLDNGWMRMAVWTYGATVVEVQVPDRAGTRRNTVVRLPDLSAYEAVEDRAYVGSTLGRFARIVPYGRLDIDGRRHQLALNGDMHHIHGGHSGFDSRFWTGKTIQGEWSSRIAMSLTSPNADQGYPGNLSCRATFGLDHRSRMTVSFAATTDMPTLCGLSNHIFWNLHGTGTIDNQVLELNSACAVEAGADFVPTGRMTSVAGTDLDFRTPRPLRGESVDCFFGLLQEHADRRHAARLFDPRSGRQLSVGTDQSGMAVYTGDGLYRARSGISFQPGPWPYGSPQPAETGSAILRPGRTYSSRTIFDFAVPEVPDHG